MRWPLAIGTLAIAGALGGLVWQLAGSTPDRADHPAARSSSRTASRPAAPPTARRGVPLPAPRVATDDPEPAQPAAPTIADRPSGPAGGGDRPAPSLAVTDAGPDASLAQIQTLRVREVKALIKARDYERARVRALDLIRDYPDEIEGYMQAVVAMCAMGERDEAQRYIDMIENKRSRGRLLLGCRSLGMNLTE